jgi:HEXXH motif-containing protein
MNSVTRHQLSKDAFAVLARGNGSAEITCGFWKTEESRRLLLLAVLINEIAARPGELGPLAPVDAARKVITRAQLTAPEATRDLLMNPGVGSGCAYALRRLRGGAESNTPLFVDLGVVHALALVAAARSGLTWSTRLPLRDGHVMLHTLGLARFPGATDDGTVEARTEGGRIRFHDGRHELAVPADGSDFDQRPDAPQWWSLRRVETSEGDLQLSVWLDDLDPMRDLGDPIPPARLDPETFARWQTLIVDSWKLLCRDYPADAASMVDGITSIVPLKHLPGWDTRSASNGEAFGGVMVSEPPDATVMAVSLIHEYQHIKLGALLHLIPLTEPDDGSLYYAPWRDDPRPLGGLVQGIYAFFGIARFWRARLGVVYDEERALVAFEYAYALQQTCESVQIGLRASGLTGAGREFLEGLQNQVDEWLGKPVESLEPQIDHLSQITADSHRIGWRLRHFRPRDGEAAALAEQMARGERPNRNDLRPAVIDQHPQLRWRQRIPSAARRLLTTDSSARPAADPVAAGENALLADDAPAARTTFSDALEGLAATARVSDEEARAWAGLAMSLKADGDLPAADVLSRRPDLVRAIYTQSAGERSTTPDEVARWLAPALPSE